MDKVTDAKELNHEKDYYPTYEEFKKFIKKLNLNKTSEPEEII